MINANELRIGNIMKSEVLGDIYIVTAATFNSVRKDGVIHLNPIPLTSEIFESCRFESGVALRKTWFNKDQEKYSIVFWYYKNGRTDISIRGTSYREDNTKIKHLHQLQNLYFVITGTELKINLNVDTPVG